MDCDARPVQDWRHRDSRHPHAHQARHRLPQHPRLGQGHHLRGRRLRLRTDSPGDARESYGEAIHHHYRPRQTHPRRFPRLSVGSGAGAAVRAPRLRQQQRRHDDYVLHQRHQRRAQDGGARLPLCYGAPDHRRLLAQPARGVAAPHRGRHRLGQGRLGQVLRTVVCRCYGVRLRPREVQCRHAVAPDGEIQGDKLLRTAHHLPLHDSRGPVEVRPQLTAILLHRRRGAEPRRVRQ